MSEKIKWLSLMMFVLIISTAFSGFTIEMINEGKKEGQRNENTKEKVISVAVYDSIFRSPKLLRDALQYKWEINGTVYEFSAVLIDDENIIGLEEPALSLENFDVFIIGASARQFIYRNSKTWNSRAKEFVEKGGGYLGICGGANAVAISMQEIHNIFDVITESGFLGMANVYSNDQHDEEWQYAWKEAVDDKGDGGGAPMNISVDTSHPIFADCKADIINIRWWAGPSLILAGLNNSKFGDINLLAVYLEEPCEKTPLHHWIWKPGRWEPFKNITTDIVGEYAGIATTYGLGRIVLFGPHPEYTTWYDGHIVEYKTRFFGWKGNKFVYYWKGNETSYDYNWWIIRRSVAYMAGLNEEELPPIE